MSASEKRIGEIEHLSIFVASPEASAKRSRMARMHLKSASVGERNTTRSSAYKEARFLMEHALSVRGQDHVVELKS